MSNDVLLTPEQIAAGERPLPELPKDMPPPVRQVGLIIDIQQRMAQGKGPAYERWAQVYNLKQMAAALQFLQENNLTDYDALAAKTTAAVDRAHALAGELQTTEAALSKISGLMRAVVDYAKARPAMNELLGGEKLSNKHFCGPAAQQKFRSVATPELLAETRNPGSGAKNGGRAFPYAPSVSLAFLIPSAAPSIMINSFSSIPISIRSICFRRSLSPPILSG